MPKAKRTLKKPAENSNQVWQQRWEMEIYLVRLSAGTVGVLWVCMREEQPATDGGSVGLALVWVLARVLIQSWNLPPSLRTAEESRSSEGVTMGPHHPMAPGAALAHMPNCRPIGEMNARESAPLDKLRTHGKKFKNLPILHVLFTLKFLAISRNVIAKIIN